MFADAPLQHIREVFLTAGADPQKLDTWLTANAAAIQSESVAYQGNSATRPGVTGQLSATAVR